MAFRKKYFPYPLPIKSESKTKVEHFNMLPLFNKFTITCETLMNKKSVDMRLGAVYFLKKFGIFHKDSI